MTSFFAEIWRVNRSLSQESKKIKFASIVLLQLQILNFEWTKVNIGRNARFDFEGCDFHNLSFYFSCIKFSERYGCQIFSDIRITSFQPLELMLYTKHRLNVKSTNYLEFTPFCIFHPNVPSKHKTKNIKAFFIYNMGKTLVKYG